MWYDKHFFSQHIISPYNIASESHTKVSRIKEMKQPKAMCIRHVFIFFSSHFFRFVSRKGSEGIFSFLFLIISHVSRLRMSYLSLDVYHGSKNLEMFSDKSKRIDLFKQVTRFVVVPALKSFPDNFDWISERSVLPSTSPHFPKCLIVVVSFLPWYVIYRFSYVFHVAPRIIVDINFWLRKTKISYIIFTVPSDVDGSAFFRNPAGEAPIL